MYVCKMGKVSSVDPTGYPALWWWDGRGVRGVSFFLAFFAGLSLVACLSFLRRRVGFEVLACLICLFGRWKVGKNERWR